MRKFTVTLISLTAALTAALTITGSATIDTRSETAAVVGGEPKTTGPGDDSHAGHDHGPVAGPGTAQASAPAESAESVGVYRWRHRVITWRLRTPAWTWSAAGQRQSIALAMAVWDSASSRITLRQTSGPADIEISYQEQSHYRGNPDASFGWNDAGHAFYPGSYTLGGDIHINSRFRWGPMGGVPRLLAGFTETTHGGRRRGRGGVGGGCCGVTGGGRMPGRGCRRPVGRPGAGCAGALKPPLRRRFQRIGRGVGRVRARGRAGRGQAGSGPGRSRR